jgi:hypothetical protein
MPNNKGKWPSNGFTYPAKENGAWALQYINQTMKIHPRE